MKKMLTKDEFDRMSSAYEKVKYICKCGHRVIIFNDEDKKLCDWCGCYVFKNKKDEFEYRIQEQIKKGR